MSTTDATPRRTARMFTAIKKIPTLIGKLGEWRIPGGPYTLVQLVTGGVVLFVGYNTMSVWGPLVGGLPLVRLVALAMASVGVIFLTGHIPSTRRTPLNLLTDWFHASTRPVAGTVDGQPVKLLKPHVVHVDVLLAELDDEGLGSAIFTVEHAPSTAKAPQIPATVVAETETAPANAPTPVPARRFTSGMDRLLEQAGAKES
ncbi:hypothetical protein [Microbacterium panaciterrae]|uniref:PrgI family protein n=1 Tax=Microbacterium panaciterrae TaxID=985759 RepID=A0ABP8PU36_9MICO